MPNDESRRIEWEARLIEVGGELRALDRRREELERAAGSLAGSLVADAGVSKSAVARILRVSQPHVTTLIDRARMLDASLDASLDARAGAGLEEPAGVMSGTGVDSVDSVDRYEAVGQLRAGRRLIRVIAGFEVGDVLLASGLDPGLFQHGQHGRALVVPNMLWQLEDGWLGVLGTNIGYGGTGPLNAEATLLEAGIGAEYARWVHRYRFFELDLVAGRHRREAVALYGLRPPAPVGDADTGENGEGVGAVGAFVARLGREDLPFVAEASRHVPSSVFRDERGRSAFEAWLRVMAADDCPGWMRGDRVARVFTDSRAALEQGFSDHHSPALRLKRQEIYQVIVEQGQLQLWLPTYPPLDPTQLLAEEAYAALDLAGLYPEEVGTRDSRSRFARYVDRFVRRRRPEFFDVSRSGESRLQHLPASNGW